MWWWIGVKLTTTQGLGASEVRDLERALTSLTGRCASLLPALTSSVPASTVQEIADGFNFKDRSSLASQLFSLIAYLHQCLALQHDALLVLDAPAARDLLTPRDWCPWINSLQSEAR
jgi:hypothetical protein